MTKTKRYLELIELAGCSPDSPWLQHPHDHGMQVFWLAKRLEDRGHYVPAGDVRDAMDAFAGAREGTRSHG